MGTCGLTEEQAGLTSYHEYELKAQAHEQSVRQAWEIARWQSWHLYNLSANIREGHKPRRPIDLVRFPWEQTEEEELEEKAKIYGRVTDDEKNELLRIFRETGLIKDKDE